MNFKECKKDLLFFAFLQCISVSLGRPEIFPGEIIFTNTSELYNYRMGLKNKYNILSRLTWCIVKIEKGTYRHYFLYYFWLDQNSISAYCLISIYKAYLFHSNNMNGSWSMLLTFLIHLSSHIKIRFLTITPQIS